AVAGDGGCNRGHAAARRARGRGRDDHHPCARGRCVRRNTESRIRDGEVVHCAGASIPSRRCAAHELPPAADTASGAGGGIRRLAARARRVRGRRRGPLPLLQLRRRDAAHVTGMRFDVMRTPGVEARRGRLTTTHGIVETPAFMPVATHGAVKGVSPWLLEELGATIVLSNAYHLAQRPGVELVQALDGVHGLLSWKG